MAANYVGDASFAFTGSLAAGLAGMDLLGCNLVGFITALGGGALAVAVTAAGGPVVPRWLYRVYIYIIINIYIWDPVKKSLVRKSKSSCEINSRQ